jgi:hypothetical protein
MMNDDTEEETLFRQLQTSKDGAPRGAKKLMPEEPLTPDYVYNSQCI